MNNPYDNTNSTSINNIHGFKQCYGRNCTSIGKNPLKIIYIHKIGWFCDNCKKDLLDLKLADEVIEQ